MMKELLGKIRGADDKARCKVAAEVYSHVAAALGNLSSHLDSAGTSINVDAFDTACNEIENVLNELARTFELLKFLTILKDRFDKHMYRHKNITWEQVEQRLREADPKKLWSLSEMERTGGEPDVAGMDKKTGELIFEDRSPESPTGRRNCCYDKEGEKELKEKYNETCNGNAVDIATAMGVELLDEKQYREAQKVDQMDLNRGSWLMTPIDKRQEYVALYGGRFGGVVRVGENFPYHHRDDRAWRGSLKI